MVLFSNHNAANTIYSKLWKFISKIILQEPSRGSVVNIFQNKIKELIEK